jgi:hypothetical protein
MSNRNIPEEGFGLVMPFVIDGEGYSDRDRAMFVAGYEFCQLHVFLEENPEDGISKPVHAENEDRIRVLCGRLERACSVSRIDGTWSQLEVEPSRG